MIRNTCYISAIGVSMSDYSEHSMQSFFDENFRYLGIGYDCYGLIRDWLVPKVGNECGLTISDPDKIILSLTDMFSDIPDETGCHDRFLFSDQLSRGRTFTDNKFDLNDVRYDA